jgi:hypothetical protein
LGRFATGKPPRPVRNLANDPGTEAINHQPSTINPVLTTQLELAPAPPADPNIRWLETLLRDAHGWLTCVQIVAASGQRLTDRGVRELASASEWIISGQRGYRHMESASPDEIHHAAGWLESQAKKMSERACAIRRNAHRRIG